MHLIQLHPHGAVSRVRLPKDSVAISSVHTVVLPGVRDGYPSRVSIHASAVDNGEIITDVTVVTNTRRNVIMSATPDSAQHLVLVLAPEKGSFDLHRTVGSKILAATFRQDHPDQFYRSIVLKLERGMKVTVEFSEGPEIELQWEGDRSIIVNGTVCPFPGEALPVPESIVIEPEERSALDEATETDPKRCGVPLSTFDPDEDDDEEVEVPEGHEDDEAPDRGGNEVLEKTGFHAYLALRRQGSDPVIETLEPSVVKA